jgi:hypothetical protein
MAAEGGEVRREGSDRNVQKQFVEDDRQDSDDELDRENRNSAATTPVSSRRSSLTSVGETPYGSSDGSPSSLLALMLEEQPANMPPVIEGWLQKRGAFIGIGYQWNRR